MAEYLIKDETLTDIADAIREINGETDQYTPSEMAGEIRNIKTVIDQLDETKLVATATGESIVLTDSSDKPLEGLVLYGKTTQDGTPSPTNPIPLVSAGNSGEMNVRVYGKNLFDKNAPLYVSGVSFGTTGWQSAAQNLRVYYLAAQPNTTYTYSKKKVLMSVSVHAQTSLPLAVKLQLTTPTLRKIQQQ